MDQSPVMRSRREKVCCTASAPPPGSILLHPSHCLCLRQPERLFPDNRALHNKHNVTRRDKTFLQHQHVIQQTKDRGDVWCPVFCFHKRKWFRIAATQINILWIMDNELGCWIWYTLTPTLTVTRTQTSNLISDIIHILLSILHNIYAFNIVFDLMHYFTIKKCMFICQNHTITSYLHI